MRKPKRITSIDNIQQGYVCYPPCSRCYEPDKEPGGGIVGDRPVCAKCFIEWLIGE